MHWQDLSVLLYDTLCFDINKKEHVEYIITIKLSKKKKKFLSLQYIRMSRKNINFHDKKKSKKAAFIKTIR